MRENCTSGLMSGEGKRSALQRATAPFLDSTQTAEERRRGRGGHLRSRHQGEHAVRRDQDARAAELPDAPSHAPSVHPPANRGDQCDPGPSCRVRDRRAGRTQGCRGTARCRCRSERQTKLAITVFDSYDDILDKACDACTFFANDQNRIASITTRSWATVIL